MHSEIAPDADRDLHHVLPRLGIAAGVRYVFLVRGPSTEGPDVSEEDRCWGWSAAYGMLDHVEPTVVEALLFAAERTYHAEGAAGSQSVLVLNLPDEAQRTQLLLVRDPQDWIVDERPVVALASLIGRISLSMEADPSRSIPLPNLALKAMLDVDAPVVCSSKGAVAHVNDAAARFLGYTTREELSGRDVAELAAPGFRQRLSEKLADAHDTLAAARINYLVVRGGTSAERSARAFMVPVSHGEQTVVLTVFQPLSKIDVNQEQEEGWFDDNTEGLFRIDLNVPLPEDLEPDLRISHALTYGYIGACNQVMNRMLGAADAVVGRSIQSYPLLKSIASRYLDSALEPATFTLTEGRSAPAFTVHVHGSFDAGRLVRIWGRCMLEGGSDIDETVLVSALEQQQRKIGVELHDGIGQLLTAARITSYDIVDDDEAAEEVRLRGRRLSELLDEASRLLRTLTSELSPAALIGGKSLGKALAALVDMVCDVSGVQCTLEFDDGITIEDVEKRHHLYRIVQEAVNNAVKHAEARNIRISGRLLADGSKLEIDVADDGIGFDARLVKKSVGLEGMSVRARLIGADLSIRSVAGTQTVVSCVVPL